MTIGQYTRKFLVDADSKLACYKETGDETLYTLYVDPEWPSGKVMAVDWKAPLEYSNTLLMAEIAVEGNFSYEEFTFTFEAGHYVSNIAPTELQ